MAPLLLLCPRGTGSQKYRQRPGNRAFEHSHRFERPTHPLCSGDEHVTVYTQRPALRGKLAWAQACLSAIGGMLRLSCSSRSGSRRASIWAILPFVTVKAITENTRPCGATTAPAAPFTSAGLTNG